jgi:hypothetical protein
MPAKVCLRNKTSKRYFARYGDWLLNRAEAFDFEDVKAALAYGCGTGLAGLEVVLENDARELTVQVPSGDDSITPSQLFGSPKLL